MSGLFVANTATPSQPLAPVIGKELSADFLITPAKGYSLNVDPASDVINTHSAAGVLLKIKPAALAAATTNVLTWDTATAKLISTVNGVPAEVVIQGGNIAIAAGDGFSGLGTTTSPLNLVIDPASTAIVTKSPTGLKIDVPPSPAAPLSTLTTFTYDAVSKKLKSAVDGTTALEVDLGALDDEGTKLVINGQNLELQNSAGTVLSSTPIGQLDAQQLTGAAAAAGYKLTLSNGGAVTITAPEVGMMFPAGTPTATTELLTKDGKAVKLTELPVLHVNTWTKADGLKEAVNGVQSNIAIPAGTIADDIGYDATGKVVHQAIGLQPDFFSSVVASADTLGSPNGVSDRTEEIRRDGPIGLNVDPNTTLDVRGSHGFEVRWVDGQGAGTTVPVTISPIDSMVGVGGNSGTLWTVALPAAADFRRRILTLRTVTESANIEVTSLGGQVESLLSQSALQPKVYLEGRAVRSVTWQSDGSAWRIIDWTARTHFATAGYVAPPGASTINGFALPVNPPGAPLQLPTFTALRTSDGNFANPIALPATNNATGRISVYNDATFTLNIASVNTDLPILSPIKTGHSMHFEWSDGLWRWVYAPEVPAAAGPTGTATVSPTGLLSMGGQTIQLIKPVSSLGTPLNYWVFPA